MPDASSNLTVDFGFVPLVSIGSIVWRDTDGDGLQDDGEPPIPGAVVELLNPDGAPATDADGNPVAPITTSGDGLYNFDNLLPGDYIIQVTPPDDTYRPTDVPSDADPDSNPSNSDSNGRPVGDSNVSRSPVITLTPGGEPTDEGESDPSGLPDANSNLTVDFGFEQPVSVGSRIWDDKDADGVQDPGEPALVGAIVELLTPDGTPVTDLDGNVVQPLTIDTTGRYNFSNLPLGDYIIQVTPPEGYVPAPAPADADPDSNPANNDSNGAITGPNGVIRSPIFTLTPGSEPTAEGETDPSGTPDASGDMTVDFGFYRIMALGNRIWFDDGAGGGIANNGIIDGAELGVSGVLVRLLDADCNPVLGPDGQPRSTRTDENGFYLFDNLTPGQYVVYIDPVNFQPGGPLAGFNSSDTTETNPNRDGDINDNGINVGTPAIDGVYSGIIELIYNSEPTNEVDENNGDAANNSSNLTIDFGFYQAKAAAVISQLLATLRADGNTIIVRWRTAVEVDTFGFHIYAGGSNRFVSARQLTSVMILSQGSQGGEYVVEIPTGRVDATLGTGIDPAALHIWLVETEDSGNEIEHGPVRVYSTFKASVFLPLVARRSARRPRQKLYARHPLGFTSINSVLRQR